MYRINTKRLIILGCLLILGLSIFGTVWIYRGKSSYAKFKELSFDKQKGIDVLSGTLASIQRTEGEEGLLTVATDPDLNMEYDSLMVVIFNQINSLKITAKDPHLNNCLDSLHLLLLKKQKNTAELLFLTQSYQDSTLKEITQQVILSKKDIPTLDRIIRNSIRQYSDTTRSSDNHSTSQEKNIIAIRNALVKFVQDKNQTAQKRNAAITSQLILKQSELYTINERTSSQINYIISNIVKQEHVNNIEKINEQVKMIEHSSNVIIVFTLIAILVAILLFGGFIFLATTNQHLRNKISESEKHTEQLLDSREQLLLTITHDIKAPLSSILGYLELMKEDNPSEPHTYYISNMQQSASHILNLIRNLLDFHSLEIILQKNDQAPFSPHVLLTDIYESFIPVARKKELRLELDMNIDKSDTYINDPYRIRQIMNNILSNAIKFTPQKGSIVLSAELAKSKRKAELLLSVKDSGPGIKEKDINRIFEEFRRLDYTKGEGLGLGLYISHKLAQSLNGSISVDSALGKGSIFTVVIPLSKIAKPVPNNINRSLKILFIDNDIIHLDLLSTLLKREGMLSRTCSDSGEALKLLQREHFDIIFSDIQMPNINGFELVAHIRSSGLEGATTVPIIGLSANSYLSETKYKEAGFSEFLTKPFTADQMLEIIHKYASPKRKEEEKVTIEIETTGKETEEPEEISIAEPDKTDFYEDEDIHEETLIQNPESDHAETNEEETVEKAETTVKEIESYLSKTGFKALIDFAGNDPDGKTAIIRSFIIETGKNYRSLKQAFESEEWYEIREIAHKMLPLMKMISAENLVLLLQDYENGSKSKENRLLLLNLIQEKIQEAENINFDLIR
jgi:signal transduction histidine kinase/CheY-like chemotaxis protein